MNAVWVTEGLSCRFSSPLRLRRFSSKGFANTPVFQSILSFGVSNVSIFPVELALGFPSNVILT